MRYRILGLLAAWLAGASLAPAQIVTDFRPAVGFYHPMAPPALNPVMPQPSAADYSQSMVQPALAGPGPMVYQAMYPPMMPGPIVLAQWARPMPVGVPQPALYPSIRPVDAPVTSVSAPAVTDVPAKHTPSVVKEKKRFSLPWNKTKVEEPAAEPASHSGGLKSKFGWLSSKLRKKELEPNK